MQYNYLLKKRERRPLLLVFIVIIYSLFLGGYIPSVISSLDVSDFYFKLLSIIIGATIFFLIFLIHLQKALRLSLYIAIFLISQTGMSYFIEYRDTTIMTSALEVHLVVVFLLLLIKRGAHMVSLQEKTFLDLPIKCYLFTGFVGILSGFLYQVRPENILVMVKPFYLYIILYYLAINVIKDEKSLKTFINFFLICNLYPFFIAAIEVTKYFAAGNIFLRLSPSWAPLNVFAAYLMLTFFILLSLFIYEKFRKKWLLAPFLIIALINILFMQTRGVWIGFIVAFFFFCYSRNKKIGIVIGLVSLIIAYGVFKTSKIDVEGVYQVARLRITTLKTRKIRAFYALSMVQEHPILGMGWGAYYVPAPNGELRQVPNLLPRWHNDYLVVASGAGLIGLIPFLWIWGSLMKKSYIEIQRKRRGPPSYLWTLQTGLFAGIAGFLITASTGQYFFRIETAAYIWFLTGVLVASLKLSDLEDQKNQQ